MEEQSYWKLNNVSAQFPDLEGKTAIVSGSSYGIGCGIAYFLGRQGLKLVLTARSEEKGRAVAAELTTEGIEAVWITADLSESDQAQRVVDETVSRFGGIDLLVNNAYIHGWTKFEELDEEQFFKWCERNIRIFQRITYHVIPQMKKAGSGTIVNISSVGGLRPHRGMAGYDMGKGAMDNMTRILALELAPYGIRANSVAPGAIKFKPVKEEKEMIGARPSDGIPSGRLGTTEEIGAAVAFLASDAAAYMTGQIIYVDGGLTTQLTPPGIFI